MGKLRASWEPAGGRLRAGVERAGGQGAGGARARRRRKASGSSGSGGRAGRLTGVIADGTFLVTGGSSADAGTFVYDDALIYVP